MIEAALDRILELSKPEIFDAITEDGRKFTSKPIYPVLNPIAAPLTGSTLTALTDFLDTAIEVAGGDCAALHSFFHVESHKSVSLVSPIFGANRQREKFITVTHEVKEFPYGHYFPVEEFIVGIQTFFAQDWVTASILKITGNVTHEAVMKVLDDGITQTVSAKTGIARVENVAVPNPVTLRPYRTFLDVAEQPKCLFVFRMKQTEKGPECALFEADSGLWKLEAISQIKTWLKDHAPEINVVG